MQDNSAAFWDRVARRYARMSTRNATAYKATLDVVRSLLHFQDHVLELGCGTGSTALKLAPSVERYVATDYSSEMIVIANEKLETKDQINLEFSVAQPGDDLLPVGPFDAVLAFNVLHLMTDRRAALGVISNRLRTGGLLISKTPCFSGPYRILQPVLAGLHSIGKAPPS